MPLIRGDRCAWPAADAGDEDKEPRRKPLQGLWLRARYAQARIDQSNVRTTIDEVRLILNYGIKLY